jgi:hypothetical protein
MPKRLAIVVLDLSDLGEEGLKYATSLGEECEIIYFTNKSKLDVGLRKPLRPPRSAIRTSYTYFQSVCIFEFLSTGSFQKVVFWGCPELSLATMRAQRFHLDFLDCSVAITANSFDKRVQSRDPEIQFYLKETLQLSVHLIESSLHGLTNFFQSNSNVKIFKNSSSSRKHITICICHKDRTDYLFEALSGFNEQTFKGFDVVVVDDGSADKQAFRNISKKISDSLHLNVRFIELPDSIGPGACRNMVAKLVHSPFILFFDDDNIPSQEMMDCLSYMTTFENIDAISCGYRSFVDNEGQRKEGSAVHFTGGPIELALKENCLGDTSTLFKRESFLRAGGFFEAPQAILEDWHLLLKMSLMGMNLTSLPVVQFSYRHHSQQRGKVLSELRGSASHLSELARSYGYSMELGPKPPPVDEYTAGWSEFLL